MTDGSEKLAEAIVESGLAGCVQMLPAMTSFYIWQGKLEREKEHLLLIKTLEDRYDELERFITEHHSYDVPEIVAVNAEHVSGPYAEWLGSVLGDGPGLTNP